MTDPVIAEIEHNTFPLVSVPKGTFVVWRNKDSVVHSAEMNPDAEPYFTAGALHPGEDSTRCTSAPRGPTTTSAVTTTGCAGGLQ